MGNERRRQRRRQRSSAGSFFTGRGCDSLSSRINVLYWSTSMKKRFFYFGGNRPFWPYKGQWKMLSSPKNDPYYSTQVSIMASNVKPGLKSLKYWLEFQEYPWCTSVEEPFSNFFFKSPMSKEVSKRVKQRKMLYFNEDQIWKMLWWAEFNPLPWRLW